MKFGKRLMSMALALVMIFGLTVNASAAVSQNVTAKLSPDITVKLGNETQAMADANGAPVYPVLYNGTTYLPVRAVGNMLGLSVNWDQVTRTVLLNKTDSEAAPTKVNSNTPSDIKSTNIAVQIDSGITVKYNDETQQMTDANGNTVYPVLYNGTTYLPVRAVSNMLNVGVEWNQDTRTVTLTKSTGTVYAPDENGVYSHTVFGDGVEVDVMSDKVTIKHSDGKTENFGFSELSNVRATLKRIGRLDEAINDVIQTFIDVCNQAPPVVYDPFANVHTSSGDYIKNINDTCIACSWGKIDWSTADDGYVTVTVNEIPGPKTFVEAGVRWVRADHSDRSNTRGYLAEGEYRIPLQAGSTEYVIELEYKTLACDHLLTEAERAAKNDSQPARLVAKFTAEIDDLETMWLLSTTEINFLDAPKTQAKALELTKNCKTDAEKITAIYNWVSNNIQYDYAAYNADVKDAQESERNKQKLEQMTDEEREKARAEQMADFIARTEASCTVLGPNGKHWDDSGSLLALGADLDPDKTLTTKTGVCRHYAALMTAMLRSVGVQCKYVEGDVYTGEIIAGYSDYGWVGHAWVAVKPKTGTLNIPGTGKDYASYSIENGKVVPTDPTGWIRLDPTNASNRALTSNDTNYRAEGYK